MKKLIPLAKFAKLHSWPDIWACKWLMAKRNPLSESFRKCTCLIEKRVHIDPDLFYQWINENNLQDRLNNPPRLNQERKKKLEKIEAKEKKNYLETKENLHNIYNEVLTSEINKLESPSKPMQLALDVIKSHSQPTERDKQFIRRLEIKRQFVSKTMDGIISAIAAEKWDGKRDLVALLRHLKAYDCRSDLQFSQYFGNYFG